MIKVCLRACALLLKSKSPQRVNTLWSEQGISLNHTSVLYFPRQWIKRIY